MVDEATLEIVSAVTSTKALTDGEALRRFDAQPTGCRMVMLVSDGLNVSRGFRSTIPFKSIDLDWAIS